MGRTPMSGGSAFRFLPSEVADMEKALDASAGATPARSIVEGLAEKFTSERNGREVQWKQVWNWFQNRRHAQKAKIDKLKAGVSVVETPPPAPRPVAPVAGSSAVKKTIDVPMDFEAKSARDGAWYDVSAFIARRDSASGEPEVKVRFAGFGSEEDEWVNIASAVRQRSLPCETTECVAVLPGDLILCFQEGSEQALYFDADILDVQRRRHDVRGCRCRFWVRYRHDQTEEVVPLRKVCRRPETEQRLILAREVSKLANNKEMQLNGTQSISTPQQLPPTTPATPATQLNSTPATQLTTTPATQLNTVFNAMQLQDSSPHLYTSASTPAPQSVQPIRMQSLATPEAVAPPAPMSTPVPAPAATQRPPPSTPIPAAPSTVIQQPATPAVPPSTSVSAPQVPPSTPASAQQDPPPSTPVSAPQVLPSTSVPPSIEGVVVTQQPTLVEQQSRPESAEAEPSVPQQPTPVSEIRDTSNVAQPMEVVSTPAAAAPEFGLSLGSNEATTVPVEVEKPPVSNDLPALPVDLSIRPEETSNLPN